MKMKVTAKIFLAPLLIFVLFCGIYSCKTPPPAMMTELNGVLRGQVRYLERIALPGDFWLEMQLVEINPDGTVGAILARSMTEKPTRSIPVSFMMRYSPKSIDLASKKYALIAGIYVGKELWFENKDPYPVFLNGDAQTDIIVQRVIK